MNTSLEKLGVGLAILVALYWLFTLLSDDPGAAEGRVAVWGNVTYAGTPVEVGTISFSPASGTNGLAAGGGITAGEYSIARGDGPTEGKYTVRILIGRVRRFPAARNPSFEIKDVLIDADGPLDFALPQDAGTAAAAEK